MKLSLSRDFDQPIEITSTDGTEVSLKITAHLRIRATPTQMIDWLLTKSQVAYAEFRPQDREMPLTYRPDEPYTDLPPSVLIEETGPNTFVVHCHKLKTYTGDVVGVIRFLIAILPRPNEDPPRL